MSKKELSPIDMLFDENNNENIVLYDQNNEKTEFEQIAIIPVEDKVYAILRPVGNNFNLGEDEAFVFSIDEIDDEDALVVVEDDSVVDMVFKEYYELLEENGVDVEVVE